MSEIEPQEPSSTFTCEICTEPVSSNKRFKNNRSCSHDSYCIDCIAHHIEAQLEEYNTANIRCPGLDCKDTLNPLTCRSILSAKLFERWCDTLCEWSISSKGCYRSYCPFLDCSTTYVSKCMNLTNVTCTTCKRTFCCRCKTPWEANHACSNKKDREGINDTQLEDLVSQNKWVRCPGCDYVIERTSGCSEILCRCGTTFCYKTGNISKGLLQLPLRRMSKEITPNAMVHRMFRLFDSLGIDLLFHLACYLIIRKILS